MRVLKVRAMGQCSAEHDRLLLLLTCWRDRIVVLR